MISGLNNVFFTFKAFLSENKDVSDFLHSLGEVGGVYLFGGVVRDIYASHDYSHVNVSDIDLVVDCGVDLPVCNDVVKNSFGGYQCFMPSGKSINYWRLCDTYAFKKNYFECSLINLPKTTVFDINAVCLGVFSGEVFESGFFAAMNSRVISFNCCKYIYDFPALQAVRAFTYAERLDFLLDSSVEDFIRDVVKGKTVNEFVQMLGSSARRNHLAVIERLCARYS